tara:strand:+ start:9248 stop:10114 length:867 start_codon:yes stop_codon:yes gene_type:complete
MNQKSTNILIKVFILFCCFNFCNLNAQFKSVKITIDNQRLKEGDKQITSNINESIKNFFLLTNWGDEIQDLQIPLDIQVLFEGIADKGSERLFSAQFLFNTGIDQRYFSKTIQFPYSFGQNINYSPVIFEPLSSALEFYGSTIIAGELDTYEKFGGTSFYEKSREIAMRGMSSQYRRGWSDRLELIDLLTKYRDSRLAKFNFYDGMAYIEENDYDGAELAFSEMINNLNKTFKRFPREHYTTIFLKGHIEDFINLNDEFQYKKIILNKLLIFDPDNLKKYQDAISKSK